MIFESSAVAHNGDLLTTLAEAARLQREAAGLSQSQVGHLAGLSRSSVRDVEHGQGSPTTTMRVLAVATLASLVLPER
jgi:transcriptional regulator with XRE-family HTH domain